MRNRLMENTRVSAAAVCRRVLRPCACVQVAGYVHGVRARDERHSDKQKNINNLIIIL